MKRYILVSKEEFKRILKRTSTKEERTNLLMNAIAVNAAMMANVKTIEENLSSAKPENEVIAERISEVLADDTISKKKLEKAIVKTLFGD